MKSVPNVHVTARIRRYETCTRALAGTPAEWIPFLALAGLIIGLFAWLRSDINILRRETNEHFNELHKEIQAIDVRLARVEATLETTFRLQGILPADRQDQVA